MATKQTEPLDADKIELRPDGWDRFRAAVRAAAKSGPKHRPKANAQARRSVIKDEGKR
jgi:hypothetical protein